KSENIHLRALEPEDISHLYKWENDRNVWQVSNTIAPYSKYILKQYIENSHLDIFETKQLRFVIVNTQTDVPIGAIDLFDFEPYHSRIGVGILIYNEDDRGRGYASEALNLTLDYCFSVLNVHQIYCNILSDNIGSISLFEKVGFEKTACKKDWIWTKKGWEDEFLYQKVRK
ncbi:MAG: GNAT family protein, partial [Rikenellaceae bacterium]